MQEVLNFLRNSATFFLATAEGDQPRVRPFGAVTEFGGRLYLITSNQKDVFRQLERNPKLELCAMDASGSWIRVTATAVVDPAREARAHMLEDMPELKSMYDPDDGKMEVFYLRDAAATICSFTDAPKTIRF